MDQQDENLTSRLTAVSAPALLTTAMTFNPHTHLMLIPWSSSEGGRSTLSLALLEPPDWVCHTGQSSHNTDK